MKKVLSLVLSLALVVCGMIPTFTPNVSAADATLAAAGASLPSEFAGATAISFIDHVSENGDLTPPSGNTPGDYTTYPNAYGPSVGVFNGAKFAVSFYVPYAGVYEFCIKNYVRDDVWKNQDWAHYGTVQIDDGVKYLVSDMTVYESGVSAVNGGYHFTGLSVELSAGTHTMYLSGNLPNGLNPYFMGAYYYCSARTGVYEELPETECIVGDSYSIGSVPSTEEMYVPTDGIYDVYALAHAGSEAGGFSVKLGETQYFIYEMEGLEAGESRYYEVARGVELSAGDRISVGKITGVTPDVTEVFLLMTDYVGITEEMPFPEAKATIAVKASANGVDNASAGGNTWFNFGVNDSGSDQGGIRPQGTYSYKFNVEIPSDGTFSIAAYIDHLYKGDLNVKFNGKTYTIDPIDVSGMRYYVLDENVTLKAGTYTAEISRADGNTAALFHSLILSADALDGISDKVLVGFENASVISITDYVTNDYLDADGNKVNPMQDENGGYNYYHWAGGDYQNTLPNKKGAMLNKNGHEIYVPLTVAEDGEYSLAIFLANGYRNATSAAFNVTVTDADGEAVGTFTVNELAGSVGSKLYYQFADNVALTAGVEYKVAISRTGATDSTLVEILTELTSVVDAAKEAAKPDDEPTVGAVGGAYVGAILMLPNMNETSESDALGQPQLVVINPVAAPAEVPAVSEKKDGTPDAPKQPYVPNPAPAAPNQHGSHPTVPARPAL